MYTIELSDTWKFHRRHEAEETFESLHKAESAAIFWDANIFGATTITSHNLFSNKRSPRNLPYTFIHKSAQKPLQWIPDDKNGLCRIRHQSVFYQRRRGLIFTQTVPKNPLFFNFFPKGHLVCHKSVVIDVFAAINSSEPNK